MSKGRLNPTVTRLGAAMRQARGDRTLEEMAVRCDCMTEATLSRIEGGITTTPSRSSLVSIAHGYGIPIKRLAALVYAE